MSFTQYLQGKAIQTGCEWRLKIEILSSALQAFPADAKFAASIRRENADGEELTRLTTDNGGIIRVNGNTLELVLLAGASAVWTEGSVVMDIIRTDLSEPIHLGFDLTVPVKRTITRI